MLDYFLFLFVLYRHITYCLLKITYLYSLLIILIFVGIYFEKFASLYFLLFVNNNSVLYWSIDYFIYIHLFIHLILHNSYLSIMYTIILYFLSYLFTFISTSLMFFIICSWVVYFVYSHLVSQSFTYLSIIYLNI